MKLTNVCAAVFVDPEYVRGPGLRVAMGRGTFSSELSAFWRLGGLADGKWQNYVKKPAYNSIIEAFSRSR